MPPKYFPLRWEFTGDQWWFASPIDWAAANGHYELVRELIQIDSNLLFSLTSLARIRRLENVWDDDGEKFSGVSRCRSKVARRLMRDCETLRGHDSLTRAGYGGWLVYTAAAAGDLDFVKELLGRDPLLVFGGGEYGATDILYAASKGGSGEVFRALLDCCLSAADRRGDVSADDFRWDVINRAVHAAARGGNLRILMELLGDGCNVLAYRDSQGSTVLHTAAGRGHVEVVKHLTSSYDIITSVDDEGNTALHVAAYHGRLPVLQFLISTSSLAIYSTNNDGDTVLHSAVAGFRAPNFQRLDRHTDLTKKLLSGALSKIDDIINVQNNHGRTPLHAAIRDNIPSEIIELIIAARHIDLHIRDCEGKTPLDLLRERTRTRSSEITIKRMASIGVVFSEPKSRDVLVSLPGSHGIGSPPGTCFEILDAEIGPTEEARHSGFADLTSIDYIKNSCSNEISSKYMRSSSTSGGRGRLGNFLRWLGKKERRSLSGSDFGEEDTLSFKSYAIVSSSRNSPVSLRQQFSGISASPHSNRRILSLQGNVPSLSENEKKLGAHDVGPKSNLGSPCSESSWASPLSVDRLKSPYLHAALRSNESAGVEKNKSKRRLGALKLRWMNSYLCLGSGSLAIEKSMQFQPQPQPYSGVGDQESLVV